MRLASRRPATWLQARGHTCIARQPRQCQPFPQIRHEAFYSTAPTPRRSLLTLAIETSCDDTCVALLSKHADGSATLHYNSKRTSDNRQYTGVNPVVAVKGHIGNLGGLVAECLPFLPDASPEGQGPEAEEKTLAIQGRRKQKPDFISVTRGPGMLSNLSIGLMTAKGLATAWQVPLLAVNHMQAHALTPHLITVMERGKRSAGQQPGEEAATSDAPDPNARDPAFPFLSLLVSGGHTILVNSRGLNDHRILASALSIAVGDALDKAARSILPEDVLQGTDDVMYGRVLESFAFPTDGTTPPDYGYKAPARRVDEVTTYVSPYGWSILPPLQLSRRMAYDFASIGSVIKCIVDKRPDMPTEERRVLARETMRMMFEHLASRVILALDDPVLGLGGKTTTRKSQYKVRKDGDPPEAPPPPADPAARVKTLVVSGGVASNRFLMHVLRSILDVRGYRDVQVTAPPPALCTDNAAMIAWTGMEMYEAGYASELTVTPIRRWPLDPTGEDGGILGADGWITRE